jgi:hypothetical protein
MATKPFITNLRLLMAAGSFLGFVGGWGLLAQAGGLADATTPAVTVVAEAPVQSTGSVTIRQPAATATVQATSTPAATATVTKTTTTTTTTTSTARKMKTGGS